MIFLSGWCAQISPASSTIQTMPLPKKDIVWRPGKAAGLLHTWRLCCLGPEAFDLSPIAQVTFWRAYDCQGRRSEWPRKNLF